MESGEGEGRENDGSLVRNIFIASSPALSCACLAGMEVVGGGGGRFVEGRRFVEGEQLEGWSELHKC